ncbi:MAG: D-alanyl-D-alanine carboxypeptidase, partial [Chlamydiia bacterium]|nr:D-alanyl-D-alanine carboxypeptidase [Chlamydiia bacterium]
MIIFMCQIGRRVEIIAFLLISLFTPSAALAFEFQSQAAAYLLINAETGAVLCSHRADVPAYPASVTKIATALYAIERGGVSLDRELTVEPETLMRVAEEAKALSNYSLPAYWIDEDGTTVPLKAKEKRTFRDLLHATLLLSANDAANVIAQQVGGTIKQFMAGLNAYLKEIGCLQTCFRNPSGLHHPDHITTPMDLARMAQVGLKNPVFSEIVASPKWPAGTDAENSSLMHKTGLPY